MSFKILITKAAEQDLDEAADYIEFTLKNPTAAYNLFSTAAEKINSLADNPKIHPIIDDPVLNSLKVRFININNYLAFYTVNEDSHSIYILRFLYGKRNWNNILKQDDIVII